VEGISALATGGNDFPDRAIGIRCDIMSRDAHNFNTLSI
jgi:hypothetical protein